ncbi:MAG TPA: AAA family ATPase [Candidatus Saccharimonadales bacterium]|nr:AAA family ATPase [Candidatus Saccharimonadales bacterium]
MKYLSFEITNFKAIKSTKIDLTRDQLVLLLGINESGKTSILEAIEAFDYTNDAEPASYNSIRNKKELNSEAKVSTTMALESSDISVISEILTGMLVSPAASEQPEGAAQEPKAINGVLLSSDDKITITRVFSFANAVFVKEVYNVDPATLTKINNTLTPEQIDKFCRELLNKTPLIIYFEDFKDKIPDYISTQKDDPTYNQDWVSTLEGLFYHADKKVNLEQFEAIENVNARDTALNKVNNALNKQFTNRWNTKLKGTKTVHRVDVQYDPVKKQFKFTAVGKDKETVFDIDERSKGAAWYLTFLLKTEFRKKRLNLDHGQTLYLIDEPGSNLHSTAQANMVHDFRTLSTDSIVVYTTHSQHLIDKANLSNVYIVKIVGSSVHAERFQDYVLGKKINTTFYQPIIDALEVQPFSLEFNWKKAVLVEGVSDYAAIRLMLESVLDKKSDFVIMPGTSASNLDTLISLHIGWGAKLMTLLDYDEEGRTQQARYKEKFPMLESKIHTYKDTKLSPETDLELEGLFGESDKDELLRLAKINKAGEKVKKKELQNALYIVSNNPEMAKKYKRKVSTKTKENFQIIYRHIAKTLR